ncbi:hypothetical protein ACWDS7_48270, partial [Streptosporangium sp. NPDC003464]
MAFTHPSRDELRVLRTEVDDQDRVELRHQDPQRKHSGVSSLSEKEGKKRMKMVGRVEVPQEAFVAALSTESSAD